MIQKGFAPYEENLDKLERWAEAEGYSLDQADVQAPDFAALGVEPEGYRDLLPRPRKLIDDLLMEFIASGLRPEEIREIGSHALAPIAGFSSLKKSGNPLIDPEEAQLRVLRVLIPHARDEARSRR